MASIPMSKNIFNILVEDNIPLVAKPVKNKHKDGKISVCLWNKQIVFVEPKSRPDTPRPAKTSRCSTNDVRSLAFECLKNKEKTAKRLEKTTACNNVTRKRSTGKFGVCYRERCTFAHSEEERRPRMCSFDLVCRYRAPGESRACTFRHSDETEAQWLKRSGVVLPKLPPTNKYNRKPKLKIDTTHTPPPSPAVPGFLYKPKLKIDTTRTPFPSPAVPGFLYKPNIYRKKRHDIRPNTPSSAN